MSWLQRISALSQAGGLGVVDLFQSTLYSGSGLPLDIVNDLDYSGKGGLAWIKRRTSTRNNILTDTVRGAGEKIVSNEAFSESTDINDVSSFNPDGFSLGSNLDVNAGGENYVAWNFLQSEKFFNVITYSGDGVVGKQIPHNLGVQAGLVLIKRLDNANQWIVQHVSRGGTKALVLNSTSSELTSSVFFNDVSMDDVNVTLGGNNDVNNVAGQYVMYAFAHDPSDGGLIQCGEYVGTGSPGNSQVLNMPVQWVMMKKVNANGDWYMFDLPRGEDAGLRANTGDPEFTSASDYVSFNSDGFTPENIANDAGSTYIYMAIRGVE